MNTTPVLQTSSEVLRPRENRKIHRDEENGVVLLTFDRPNSAANIFDRATLLELKAHLAEIQQMPDAKGLVLLSAKPSIFLAGADLKALATLRNSELLEFLALGQETMNLIESLRIPTIAAIHGACVGGGFEMSLACDYRLASNDRATRIGLPETKLGIIPAWGGSTRLPRTIGVPRALDVILGGKVLPAKAALKLGMVDEVVPREYLRDIALRRIAEGLPRKRHRILHSKMVGSVIAKILAPRVREKIRQRNGMNYPALESALQVVTTGISEPLAKSLESERLAVVELAKTDACRNLLRLFFAQEAAKKRMAGTEKFDEKIAQTAVIGAGVMGSGIAQWLASRGIAVILRDIAPERVAAGMASIAKLFASGVKRHSFSKTEARAGFDRISPAASMVPLERAQIVIEAAVEKMELKKQVFAQLAGSAAPNTILATNTSALSITEIGAATRCPERVVGIHFFNPVHRMQLVEIVRGEKTSAETVQRALQFAQQIGKLPVIVRDRPGFLVNRILMPYLIEAARCFEAGASVYDLDRAMTDFGMPMGPLRLMDEVGLDICSDVAATLARHFSDRMAVPGVLQKMIAAGMCGKKCGRGFYDYRGHRKPRRNAAAKRFQRKDAPNFSHVELQRRMVLLMVNEAARCYEERVAETAADIDFAMVMGTGFAPFRGGPLRFADAEGVAKIVNELKRLSDAGAPEFQPCETLLRMGEKGGRFYED